MFPRLCFRKAYDALREAMPANADKNYLKILQLAKLHSEQEVSEALELLLQERQRPTAEAVKTLIDAYKKERSTVHVYQPRIADYDSLLTARYEQEVH